MQPLWDILYHPFNLVHFDLPQESCQQVQSSTHGKQKYESIKKKSCLYKDLAYWVLLSEALTFCLS